MAEAERNPGAGVPGDEILNLSGLGKRARRVISRRSRYALGSWWCRPPIFTRQN